MSAARIIIRRNCGFFSDFFTALNGAMWCAGQGMAWHVDWRSRWYNDGEENLWDRYFWQPPFAEPCSTTYENVTPAGYFLMQFFCHCPGEAEFMAAFSPTVAFLKATPILASPAVRECGAGFDAADTLGVYHRGTDRDHVPIVPSDEVMRCIKAELRARDWKRILFCTEDQRHLDRARAEFGDLIVATDSFRSPDSRAVHCGNVATCPKSELARDVLRDALWLSQCPRILAVQSNVVNFSVAVALQRPAFGVADLVLMDKGKR
jgi:hypothetical protein